MHAGDEIITKHEKKGRICSKGLVGREIRLAELRINKEMPIEAIRLADTVSQSTILVRYLCTT